MYWYINGCWMISCSTFLCGSMPRQTMMFAAMPATVPYTGQTTWSRNWFPSITSISGSNGEEIIDPSLSIRIDLSDLRRQQSLMSDVGIEMSRFWPTIICRAKQGVDVKHGYVVHRRCLRFLHFVVFPLDEIVLRIPPGCDAMKSFCTVVPNSSTWCLLNIGHCNLTSNGVIQVIGWWCEWMRVGLHLQFGAHPMAIRYFQLPSLWPFPFVFFSFGPCLLVRRWIHIIKGINGLRANWEEGNLHSNLISIGWDALETASTSTLSGIYLLCKLVFWYIHADTSVSTVCP